MEQTSNVLVCVYSKIIPTSTHNIQSKKLNTALRNAIRDQILAYKNIINDLKCVYCGSVENCEIDHIIPFSVLCNEFFDTIDKTQIPTEFYKDIQRSCSLYFLEKDADFKEKWKTHHQNMATFQVLCKSCNRKKGGQYIQDEYGRKIIQLLHL
jgi:5-methylcytosine-specific restriction endonuclease McrA